MDIITPENYKCVNDAILFCHTFNKNIDDNLLSLISNYKKLIFSNYESLKIAIKWNNKLHEIEDQNDYKRAKFNKSIKKLPSTLTYISLGDSFNNLINLLPRQLNYLNTGDNFNKKVDNLCQLKKVRLGNKFDKNIDYLPNSLNALSLGFTFNKKVNNLSTSLKKIKLGFYFDKPLIKLPKKLNKVVFINSRFYNRKLPRMKHDDIIELKFKYKC